MATEALLACSHCAVEVSDAAQRTCPGCLRALTVKRFATREHLAAYRADAQSHGRARPVEPSRRPYLVGALTFAAVVLLAGVAGMLYTSVAVAGASSIQIAASAVVPLGIALALIEVARRYRRGDA